MDGTVAKVGQQGGKTFISGWASDGAHYKPAHQVAVFVQGRANHDQHAVVSRRDLVEAFDSPALEKAGFRVVLPGSLFDHPRPTVRVFAISSEGLASELRYRREYSDGNKKRRLGSSDRH